MAEIYKTVGGRPLHDYVAHRPAVIQEVAAKAREVQAVAEGIFSPHDHPGGHSIKGGQDGITDSYIYLEGPVPLIVEYGRAGYVTTKAQRVGNRVVPAGTHIAAWEGTHVLTRTYEAF